MITARYYAGSMTYKEFAELPIGTVFCFGMEFSNSLFFIQDKKDDAVYVQEITQGLPPRYVSEDIWNRKTLEVYKVYTSDDVQKLIDLLSVSMGMVEEG